MQEVKAPTTTPRFAGGQTKSSSEPSTSYSIAHLSDLHLTTLTDVKISQLLNKRLLGYLSWVSKRRHAHCRQILERLCDDLKANHPDHTVVTGDLTFLGLPQEYVEAGHWLTSLGTPDQVTVVPGNHDAYAGNDWINSFSTWEPYLASDNRQGHSRTGDYFPSLRIRDRIAMIGLCSARPSLPGLAIGSLGNEQLDRLGTLLENTGRQGLMRIILIHHPPSPEAITWRKRLADGKALTGILAQYGAELILHGHAHAPVLSSLPGPMGRIPVVGAASASERSPDTDHGAEYNTYTISRVDQVLRVVMTVRAFSPKLRTFVTKQVETLDIPPLATTATSLKETTPEF